jgi:hypothetical protein
MKAAVKPPSTSTINHSTTGPPEPAGALERPDTLTGPGEHGDRRMNPAPLRVDAECRDEARRAMANCVICGRELHPERAEKYDYCTDLVFRDFRW